MKARIRALIDSRKNASIIDDIPKPVPVRVRGTPRPRNLVCQWLRKYQDPPAHRPPTLWESRYEYLQRIEHELCGPSVSVPSTWTAHLDETFACYLTPGKFY